MEVKFYLFQKSASRLVGTPQINALKQSHAKGGDIVKMCSGRCLMVVVSALVALVSPFAMRPAAAQQKAEVTPGAGDKVSVDFKDAPIREAVEALFKAKPGANKIVKEGVFGNVNLSLKDIEWETALKYSVEQVKARVRKDDNGVYIIEPDPKYFQQNQGGIGGAGMPGMPGMPGMGGMGMPGMPGMGGEEGGAGMPGMGGMGMPGMPGMGGMGMPGMPGMGGRRGRGGGGGLGGEAGYGGGMPGMPGMGGMGDTGFGGDTGTGVSTEEKRYHLIPVKYVSAKGIAVLLGGQVVTTDIFLLGGFGGGGFGGGGFGGLGGFGGGFGGGFDGGLGGFGGGLGGFGGGLGGFGGGLGGFGGGLGGFGGGGLGGFGGGGFGGGGLGGFGGGGLGGGFR